MAPFTFPVISLSPWSMARLAAIPLRHQVSDNRFKCIFGLTRIDLQVSCFIPEMFRSLRNLQSGPKLVTAFHSLIDTSCLLIRLDPVGALTSGLDQSLQAAGFSFRTYRGSNDICSVASRRPGIIASTVTSSLQRIMSGSLADGVLGPPLSLTLCRPQLVSQCFSHFE